MINSDQRRDTVRRIGPRLAGGDRINHRFPGLRHRSAAAALSDRQRRGRAAAARSARRDRVDRFRRAMCSRRTRRNSSCSIVGREPAPGDRPSGTERELADRADPERKDAHRRRSVTTRSPGLASRSRSSRKLQCRRGRGIVAGEDRALPRGLDGPTGKRLAASVNRITRLVFSPHARDRCPTRPSPSIVAQPSTGCRHGRRR